MQKKRQKRQKKQRRKMNISMALAAFLSASMMTATVNAESVPSAVGTENVQEAAAFSEEAKDPAAPEQSQQEESAQKDQKDKNDQKEAAEPADTDSTVVDSGEAAAETKPEPAEVSEDEESSGSNETSTAAASEQTSEETKETEEAAEEPESPAEDKEETAARTPAAAKKTATRKAPEKKTEPVKPAVITPTELDSEEYFEYPSITDNKMVIDFFYCDNFLWSYGKCYRYECPAGEVVTLQIPERMQGRFNQDDYNYYRSVEFQILSCTDDSVTIKLPEEFSADSYNQYKDYRLVSLQLKNGIFETTVTEPAVSVLPDVDPEIRFFWYEFESDPNYDPKSAENRNSKIHLSKLIQDLQLQNPGYRYKVIWKKLDAAGKSLKPSAFDEGWTAMSDGEPFQKGYYYDINILVNNYFPDAITRDQVTEYSWPLEIYINDKPADAVNYSKNNIYWIADFEKLAISVDKIFDPIRFVLSYNTNGGNTLADAEADNGGFVKNAAAPLKNGFTFGGWYADEALTIPFDFSQPLTADTVIYAKWIVPEKPEKTTGGTEKETAEAAQKASGSQTVKTTAVRLVKKAAPEAASAASEKTVSGKTAVGTASPETGDRSDAVLYALLLAAAAAGTAAFRRKAK